MTPDPAAALTAWNSAHKPGLLVQWRSTGDHWRTGVTWTRALLQSDVPTVRLTTGQFVPLADVRPHPAVARLAELEAVEVEDLDFPPPDCSYCLIPTGHDGDGFRCPQCDASWDSNGRGGSRSCVECFDSEAKVVGEDQQPRCLPCAAGVLDGTVDATAPYECRQCLTEVVGIGDQHPAYAGRLCGGCANAKDQAASLSRILAKVGA
jgi:hypothetical protein